VFFQLNYKCRGQDETPFEIQELTSLWPTSFILFFFFLAFLPCLKIILHKTLKKMNVSQEFEPKTFI